jgi:hypothetical protein
MLLREDATLHRADGPRRPEDRGAGRHDHGAGTCGKASRRWHWTRRYFSSKTPAEGLALVEDGKAAALAGDRIALLTLAKRARDPDKLQMLDQDYSYEPYAIALPRGDADLRLAVNRELARPVPHGRHLGGPEPLVRRDRLAQRAPHRPGLSQLHSRIARQPMGRILHLAAAFVAALVLSFGTPRMPPLNRRGRSARDCGHVQQIRVSESSDWKKYAAPVGGAVVGGVIGNQFGGGSGKTAMTVVGALGGGLLGHKAEVEKS